MTGWLIRFGLSNVSTTPRLKPHPSCLGGEFLLNLIFYRIKMLKRIAKLVGFHFAFVGAEEGFVAFV